MEKTIAHLKTKAWYRFLKVVYITAFILIMLVINGIWFEEGFDYAFNFLIGDVAIVFIFYLIRGAFYYIALGQFNAKK